MKKLGFLTPAVIVFFCASASVAMSFGSRPQENFDETCEQRMNILERDLQKVLLTPSYPRKYRTLVRTKRDAVMLKKESVKEELQEIRQGLSNKNMTTIDCLLKTTVLVVKLHKIASAGGKSLDEFSSRWRQSFSTRPK